MNKQYYVDQVDEIAVLAREIVHASEWGTYVPQKELAEARDKLLADIYGLAEALATGRAFVQAIKDGDHPKAHALMLTFEVLCAEVEAKEAY